MPHEPWGAGPGPINRSTRRMNETGQLGGCGCIVLIALALLVYTCVASVVNAL